MTRFAFRPVDADRDAALLHAWVTHPRSRFWEMQAATVDEVRAEHARIAADPHHRALVGLDREAPAFLLELYDPAHSPLADRSEIAPGDIGMHLLVAPPSGAPEPGYTSAVFRAAMERALADPAIRRVVVEPDVRNAAIRRKNVAAGFDELGEIALPGKRAMLSVCTREAFARSAAVCHLAPAALERAQRHLVAKAIAEYAHERLIAPQADGDGWILAAGDSRYAFAARIHALEHWSIDEESLRRTVRGDPAPLDAQALVAELAPDLGVPPSLLPVYLEEIASTLAAGAWKATHARVPVAELVRAASAETDAATGYQAIESAMTEGHPAFVANNGRIGFGVDDYRRFAPETGSAIRLVWIAARRDATVSAASADVDADAFLRDQLDADALSRFRRRLEAEGLDPDAFVLVPVHPWQWENKLAITFAPDLARRDLVFLGEDDQERRAQQSIRTFFDPSRPERPYVKVALSIQNMGFMRGLSPAYMEATPAINDWVAGVMDGDPEFAACGLLREVSAVGYTGDVFHRLADASPHRKMIAALWRESPIPRLSGDERVATLASLLHRDAGGNAFVSALIAASGRDARDWVHALLTAYLRPVAHCLLAHGVVFMPHSENIILRLDGGVPVGIFLKDTGEETAVVTERPLPAEIERIRSVVPPDVAALAIHTDVMDGVLRFLAAILDEDGVLPEDAFWGVAREVLEEHADAHPELAEQIAAYDLLRDEFAHSCLNRLQLRNTLQMVDLADQASSLQMTGTLRSPLAGREVPQPAEADQDQQKASAHGPPHRPLLPTHRDLVRRG